MNATDDNWKTVWLRGGKISQLTWIGPDTLAWCSGLHIVFFDAKTNKLYLPRFPNNIITVGATCLSGHSSYSMFAFAEKERKPKIYVYTYPSLTQLSICNKGTNHAYLATGFNGSYLVSLDSIPDFKLTVWCWRTGGMLTSVNTSIHDGGDYGQTLRLNYTWPVFIAQVGNTSAVLSVWQMITCNKVIILNENKITLPQKAVVRDVAWSPDANDLLAIADGDGHIYLTNHTGSKLKRIVLSQRCGVCVEIEPAAICWYLGGIVLRTTFCQIKYYRKDNDFWRKVWHENTSYYPCALSSYAFRTDRLFFATREGHIVQINSSADISDVTFDVKYFNGGNYRFIDFLHPWDEQIVACDKSMILSVIEAHCGTELAKVDMAIKGNVTYMVSHFNYPLVIVCTDIGEVVFLSFLHPDDPKILGKYLLHSDVLDLMKLSSSGSHLAVCRKEYGICFIFNVSHLHPINVLTELNVQVRMVDIVLFDTQNGLKLFVLYQSSNISTIGHKLILFELPKGQTEFQKSSSIISMTSYFQSLHGIPHESNTFVATPYLTKQLRFFKTTDWKDVINFNTISNHHNLRQVKIITDKKWFITCGIDGSIIVRSNNVKSHKNLRFHTHHRHDFGTVKAIFSSNSDLLLALGFDGSIVTLRQFNPEDEELSNKKFKYFHEFVSLVIESYKETTDRNNRALGKPVVEFLSTSVQHFGGDVEFEDITWVEWKNQQSIEGERKMFANEKEKIVSSFTRLKNKIIDLLDKNEFASELERLPISKFALDKNYREQRMKAAKDRREDVRQKLEFDSLEMERVADWIQTNLWTTQKVVAQSIFGMFNETEVTNYAITHAKPNTIAGAFDYSRFAQSVMSEFLFAETIYPWRYCSDADISLLFDKQVRVKKPGTEENIDTLIERDEEYVVDEEEELNKRLFEGLTTHHFIEPSAACNSQFKVYAFTQILFDNRIIIEDRRRLRYYFNKLFEEMYSVKEREMSLVQERIDRALFIVSELRLMFNDIVQESLTYPDWQLREKPQNLLQVSDDEIASKLYVSPSQQEIIDRQAAEEERLRLARLADDFRERALQAMMDGVLEVRWEDLIKRDVPKPEFMLAGKSQEDYTDEEVAAVKRYEQDCAKLSLERNRYRKLLHTDYAKINAALRDGIDKFNSRLEEFHLMKMKVEASIQQLNLRYVKQLAMHVNRIHAIKVDDNTKKRIEERLEAIARIGEETKVIQELVEELQERYDSLTIKDKHMEKASRNEFSSLNKSAAAAITMQYKRRPKTVFKVSSAKEVLDLGKSIRSAEKLPHLNVECLDYLRHLDALEVPPANLPHTIETHHWNSLIALRRLKIEHELKLNALAIDLNKAARILANYSAKQAEYREHIDKLREQLDKTRDERLKREIDTQLQLVLKMGQVEIPETLHGNVKSDTANAVLVPKVDIDLVNVAVVAAGKKKLKTMQRSLQFRRGIIFEEWQHRCLQMKLDHFGVELYYVRMANVTREIREFLRRTAKGLKDDKNAHRMRKEFEMTRSGQEKLLKDWESKLETVVKEVRRLLKKNAGYDRKIEKMNVDRCDMELRRDTDAEARQKDFKNNIFLLLTERSAVVRKLLANYEEILELRRKKESIACVSGAPVREEADYVFDVVCEE